MEEAGDLSEDKMDEEEEEKEIVEVEAVTHQPSQVEKKYYVLH